MKDLILLHWMMEDCKKNKNTHKECVCNSGNVPDFNDSIKENTTSEKEK